MDNKTRYDLMVQLSDFYVKNVQKNLDGFNKARFIANTSRYIFFAIFILVPILFGATMLLLLNDTPAAKSFLATLTFLTLLFTFAGSFYIGKLKEMDDQNIIQVFNQSPTYDEKTLKKMADVYKFFGADINKVLEEEKKKSKSITLPMSADDEIKKHLMPKFLNILGDFNWNKGYNYKNWKDMKFIKSLKILNNPLSMIDDCITGVYNGINVKIFDANTSVFKIEFIAITIFLITWLSAMFLFLLPVLLVILGIFLVKHFTSKGFYGVIVELDMNKKFEGHTFILEKNNIKDNLAVKSSEYEKINLEDTEFSQEFCVYSQNQIEARYILTTAFIERLKKLKEIYKAKYIRAAFKDEKIIILIQTGRDMFQMAGKSAMTKETFIQLFDEITSVLDIIDILKLNEKLGL